MAQAEEKWWEKLPTGRAQQRGDKAPAAIALLLKRYFEIGNRVRSAYEGRQRAHGSVRRDFARAMVYDEMEVLHTLSPMEHGVRELRGRAKGDRLKVARGEIRRLREVVDKARDGGDGFLGDDGGGADDAAHPALVLLYDMVAHCVGSFAAIAQAALEGYQSDDTPPEWLTEAEFRTPAGIDALNRHAILTWESLEDERKDLAPGAMRSSAEVARAGRMHRVCQRFLQEGAQPALVPPSPPQAERREQARLQRLVAFRHGVAERYEREHRSRKRIELALAARGRDVYRNPQWLTLVREGRTANQYCDALRKCVDNPPDSVWAAEEHLLVWFQWVGAAPHSAGVGGARHSSGSWQGGDDGGAGAGRRAPLRARIVRRGGPRPATWTRRRRRSRGALQPHRPRG